MEPLLDPKNNRLTVYPIKYMDIWNWYKKMQAANWTAEEIDFSNDYDDYQKMNTNEQHFIKMVLAFFAASDTIVNMNLSENFITSKAEAKKMDSSSNLFKSNDEENVKVLVKKAVGEKCPRCWKIFPHPCKRCNQPK